MGIYEQLIWTVQVKTCCPKHHKHLQDRCSNYGKHVSWHGKHGYCSKCNSFLGKPIEVDSANDLEVQMAKILFHFGIVYLKLRILCQMQINQCCIRIAIYSPENYNKGNLRRHFYLLDLLFE